MKPPPGPQDAAATSADVAEWGERWLSAWIDEATTPDERETRQWLAAGWHAWSLETWLQVMKLERSAYNGKEHSEYTAEFQAMQHVRLYWREQVGLLVWRAYREYRARGEPVPEFILAKFDQWAARLEDASGEAAVSAAIEMSGARRGPQGAALLSKVERQRRIVSDVALLTSHGVSQTKAQRRVAKAKGLTLGAVKMACSRWEAKTRDLTAAPDEPATDDAPVDALSILRNLGTR